MEHQFIHREIEAITAKWREIQRDSQRKGEALAMDYRLYIHPDLWRRIKEYLPELITTRRDPPVFRELEFLELEVNCDPHIEGWLILPVPLP